MSRLRLSAALATATFATAAVGVGLTPAHAVSTFDQVNGGYGLGASTSTISAIEGPAGGSGQVSTNVEGQGRVFSGDVVCVNAEGNRASVELQNNASGLFIVAYYEDNGPAGGEVPDRVGNGPAFTATPQGCPDPDAFFANFGIAIESGNLVVTDGRVPDRL